MRNHAFGMPHNEKSIETFLFRPVQNFLRPPFFKLTANQNKRDCTSGCQRPRYRNQSFSTTNIYFLFPFSFSFMKILWSNHVVHVDSLLWWWALWLVKIMMQNQEAIIPPPVPVIPHQVWLLQQRIADFPQLDGFFVFLHSSISWPPCLFGFCTRM